MLSIVLMELNNGHKLQNGKYRIEKKIGQGGFGITYLARCYEKIQSAMGSTSAYYIIVIKEFFWSRFCSRDKDGHSVSISSTEGIALMSQFKKKLKKEGEIISKLSHPHIVGILDIFEENNTAYLVMQYVEGESLNEIINKTGKLDETVALRYTKQICSALAKIHSRRILHLDIKPSNILIDEDNQVKLIDFGISKQYDETEHETSNTPIGISAGYSPIEQYGALKSFLPPTDIYALGATLYKMLTGQTPIAATTRSEFDLEPVTHFNPAISIKTEAAVAKAMNEKVRERFQTVQEFMQALTDYKTDEYNDEITRVDIPSASNITIHPDDTKIEKQTDIIEKPKPIAIKPDIIEKQKPIAIKPETVEKHKPIAIKPETVEKPKLSAPPVKPLKKNPVQPAPPIKTDSKPSKNTTIYGHWKIIVPVIAFIVVLAGIVFSINRKMQHDRSKNEMTTVVDEIKTIESSQAPSATQSTNTQTDLEKENQEIETQAKLEAERLRKAKEEQDKLAAEKLRKDKEEQEKREAERLRKAKEEQDKLAAEKLRKEKEEQEKREAERLRKAKEEQDRLAAEKLRKEKEEQEKRETERLRKEKEEQDRLAAEKLRKEKEEQDKRDAANFLQQANNTFKNSSLGTARLEQSFQLYLKAKEKGGDVTEGYRNFMSVAQALIGGGAGFDSNVKQLLVYAQSLNNTKEVRDLLEKCK